MTKSLQQSEKEALVSLYLAEAIQNFPYPGDDFFEHRKNKEMLRREPKSAQLNGLWQMTRDAEKIDDICNELIHKVSKATLPEWRIEVVNTLEIPRTDKKVELWKFLAAALIDIREKTDSSFLGHWLAERKRTLNGILQDNGYEPLPDITLSDQQRLELARRFIHRFVTRIIVRRK